MVYLSIWLGNNTLKLNPVQEPLHLRRSLNFYYLHLWRASHFVAVVICSLPSLTYFPSCCCIIIFAHLPIVWLLTLPTTHPVQILCHWPTNLLARHGSIEQAIHQCDYLFNVYTHIYHTQYGQYMYTYGSWTWTASQPLKPVILWRRQATGEAL